MKQVKVFFRGIDSWNRPIFKDLESNQYFGSTYNLYGYAEEERASKDYESEESLKQLSYFGSHFDCEPYGLPLEEMDVQLVRCDL